MNVSRTFLPMILLGDSQVGKTALSTKTVNNEFSEKMLSTIGKELFEKKVTVEGHSIKIKIHDTAGQERYKSIAVSSVRNALGIMLVYAINQRESFLALEGWLDQINNADKEKPLVILGNKCDLPENLRTVTYEEGKQFAEKYGYHFYECSAKSGDNVEKAFDDIIMQMYQKHKNEFTSAGQQNLQLKKNVNQNKKKSRC